MLWRLGLALILTAVAVQADPLTHIRTIPLVTKDEGFGGLSGIETLDGQRMIVLSDRGKAFWLDIDRASHAVTVTPTRQPQPQRDSEGLAYAGDRLVFSYEDPAFIVDENGVRVAGHPDFAGYAKNGSLEAIAATDDGTLYTLPERSGAKTRPFPIYRYRTGTWDIVAKLPRQGPFLPVGADLASDGRFYILERAFSPLGFRTRIRRMDLAHPATRPQTLLTTQPARHDNLEGLTIWQSESGATCLTMISDDNFLSVQRTELVEYALTETLEGGATCD